MGTVDFVPVLMHTFQLCVAEVREHSLPRSHVLPQQPVPVQSQMKRFQPSLQTALFLQGQLSHCLVLRREHEDLTPAAFCASASCRMFLLRPSMNRSRMQPTQPQLSMAVQSSVGRMSPARFSGSPPRYMSPSRSRISLSPLAVNGVRRLFTDIVPA